MNGPMAARRVPLAILLALLAAAGACGTADPAGTARTDQASGSATKRWRPLREANLDRTEVGAARIGRSIYVVGGFLPSSETTNAVERYEIRADRWTQVEPMPVAVNHPAVASYRGRLYVYGGYTDSNFAQVTSALQRYDPATGDWSLLPSSSTPRAAAALVAVGGRLCAVGGAAGGQALSRLEVFVVAKRRWTAGPAMGVAREHIAATAAAGDVYVLGGRTEGRNLRTVERYNPRSRNWKRLPPLRTARSGFAAVTVRGVPVAFGGEQLIEGGTTIRPVELFDPDQKRWRRLPGMRTPRHGLGGAALGRRVYALEGGPMPGFAFSNAIEFLDVPLRLTKSITRSGNG